MLQTALVAYCILREDSAAPENVWSRSRGCHTRAGCCALHDTDTHDEESKKNEHSQDSMDCCSVRRIVRRPRLRTKGRRRGSEEGLGSLRGLAYARARADSLG
jgi:hypothetical protein